MKPQPGASSMALALLLAGQASAQWKVTQPPVPNYSNLLSDMVTPNATGPFFEIMPAGNVCCMYARKNASAFGIQDDYQEYMKDISAEQANRSENISVFATTPQAWNHSAVQYIR